MPNQYSRLTKENILRKMSRQRNPVTSVVQLAREFGINTAYVRAVDIAGGREGQVDHAAPASFRRQVKTLIGQRQYDRLRNRQAVNARYR